MQTQSGPACHELYTVCTWWPYDLYPWPFDLQVNARPAMDYSKRCIQCQSSWITWM